MRTIPGLLVIAALALALAGCKKADKKGDQPADRPAPVKVDDGAGGKVAPDPAGDMAKKAGNCPSTVAGARTRLAAAPTDGVVALEITSDDELAVPTIRSRTRHLVEVQAAPADKVVHTGKGTGGGEIGICPVVTSNTKVAFEEIAGGVKVTMTPQGDLEPGALLAEVEQRIVKADLWTAEHIKQTGEFGALGGDGGGKGGHGANRVGKGDASGPREADVAK